MAEYIVEYPDDIVSVSHIEECINVHERIVRCKDCKFINRYDMSCRRWSHDNGVCYMAKHVSDDGFCAWGERR